MAELQYGIAKSTNIEKNKDALDKFLTPFEIIDFGESATEIYGKIEAKLEKKGMIIGSLDMLITANSISFIVILVTNNEKEFVRIEDLKIENWAI